MTGSSPHEMGRGTKMALAVVLLGGALVASVAILLPALQGPSVPAKSPVEDAQVITRALISYAGDHGGNLPRDLGNFGKDVHPYLAQEPSAEEAVREGFFTGNPGMSNRPLGRGISVLIYSKALFQGKVIVGRSDGSVDRLSPPEVQKALDSTKGQN